MLEGMRIMMTDDKIIGWFSTKTGRHIPIKEGQTKEQALNEALKNDTKNAVKQNVNRDFKQKLNNFSKRKEEAARLNKLTAERISRHAKAVGNHVYFNDKEIPKLDISSANAPDKEFPKGDSLYSHLQKNGQLTPERAAVHRRIIEKYLGPCKPYKEGEEKLALFTGGGGASGKGKFSKNVGNFYSKDDHPAIIDPDEIKKDLAAADGTELNDKLTGYYHEESSSIAKQIYELALSNNLPCLYDGTATGIGSVLKKLALAEKFGYKTEMSFVFSDWDTVRQNSLDRFRNQGRLVPIRRLLGAHIQAYSAVLGLQDKFDSFKLYDNAGRNLRQIGASSKGKKLKISDQTSWERFKQSPQEFALSEREINRYLADADKIAAERKKAKK